MTEAEQELIEGLRRQDPKAQWLTLQRYGKGIFAQVARLVPGKEDAEEVYQDVFVKAFAHIGQYDESRSSLRTWLTHIAYHAAVDRLRHQRQPVVYFEDGEGKAEVLSDQEVDDTLGHPNEEMVQLIRAALKYLPPEERAIITMFYYEEMSLKEIAFVTGSIPTTVASKLSRTRKKLCRIIKMLQS